MLTFKSPAKGKTLPPSQDSDEKAISHSDILEQKVGSSTAQRRYGAYFNSFAEWRRDCRGSAQAK
jgi:hypothetical protein